MTKSKKNKRPTWFKLYLSNKALIDAVSDEAAGRGLKLALRYFDVGEFPTDTDPLTMAVFNALRAAADEAEADYEASVEAGAAGAAVRWNRGKKEGKSRMKEVKEMEIKPIETVYKGYRFRSRAEARWAIFFESASIPYLYEPEGFEAEDGTKYLPDFYLPDQETFFECKGVLNDTDAHKIKQLAKATGKEIVVGHPDMRFEFFGGSDEAWLCQCKKCNKVYFLPSGDSWACRCCGYYDGDHGFDVLCHGDDPIPSWGDIYRPIEEARSARFEHGEKPAV